MNYTQNEDGTDTVTAEEAERQRVRDLLKTFRAGLEALDDAQDGEWSNLQPEILATLIAGHRELARHVSAFASLVEELWPENVGRHATVTAAQISAASYPLASLYGQITHLPMAS
ncbi:hypothetical protein [Glycomyces sp. NPDC047010]|uniref:hypothetical protein n=1 Tax=Glycomyces sp. NPDC047010 TaxID=3155023 RepID=UPI0033FE95CC